MTDSLVAINLLDKTNNTLINPTLVPLLFYWNGEDDVVSELRNNQEFIDFIAKHITELNYTNTDIGLFYFTYINETEDYKEINKGIQDVIYLNMFNSDNIVNHYIKKHFCELYKISLKQDYPENDETVSTIICNIYKVLKDKFKNRITKPTVINWVRSVIVDTDKFNANNSNYIINKLTEILKDYD